MILSISHNFIFIHVPKTAGTAMTAALEPYAVTGTRTLWRRLLRRVPLREAPERAYFRKHETARDAAAKMGPEVFARFFRFSVVRDPFDHAVSHYEYLKEFRNPRRAAGFAAMSFAEYLDWRVTARGLLVPSFSVLPDQAHWLVDGEGQLMVDRILRFETLAADWARLVADIGLPGLELLHVNRTRAKSDRKPFAAYYTPDTEEAVRRLYRRDFALFGYADRLGAAQGA